MAFPDSQKLSALSREQLMDALGVLSLSTQDANDVGVYQASVGAAWVDVASAAFDSLVLAGKVGVGSPMLEVTVVNTHLAQILYVLLRTSAAEATTAALPVQAGGVVTIPTRLSARGSAVVSISLQGSGATTTGYVLARFASA